MDGLKGEGTREEYREGNLKKRKMGEVKTSFFQ